MGKNFDSNDPYDQYSHLSRSYLSHVAKATAAEEDKATMSYLRAQREASKPPVIEPSIRFSAADASFLRSICIDPERAS